MTDFIVGLALFCLLPAQTSTFDGARVGDERQISGLKFCWAPAGAFRMGSLPTEQERRLDGGPVAVTLSRGFWTGKYEVTQGEWKAVMQSFPREPDWGVGDHYPVYWVSYSEA